MKFAYKENDCVEGYSRWESCSGCIFEQLADKRIWPCDLIPTLNVMVQLYLSIRII